MTTTPPQWAAAITVHPWDADAPLRLQVHQLRASLRGTIRRSQILQRSIRMMRERCQVGVPG